MYQHLRCTLECAKHQHCLILYCPSNKGAVITVLVYYCTDQSVASALHSVVEPFLLRRVKSEVMEDLPAKTEVVLYTGLSSMQKNYYKAILTKDLST